MTDYLTEDNFEASDKARRLTNDSYFQRGRKPGVRPLSKKGRLIETSISLSPRALELIAFIIDKEKSLGRKANKSKVIRGLIELGARRYRDLGQLPAEW